MADDIEEFLRRAAARRAAKQQPPQLVIKEDAIIEAEEAPARLVPAPTRGRPQPPQQGRPQQGRPQQPIQPHIAPPHLAAGIEQADEVLDQHMHDVFDHSVGQLTEDQVADDDPKDPRGTAPATPFLALLRNPESVRQAIILSEILKRPEERW